MFHAIVSVMEVKIQFSSPKRVLRSVCFPGMRSSLSIATEFFVRAERVKHLHHSSPSAMEQKASHCLFNKLIDKLKSVFHHIPK